MKKLALALVCLVSVAFFASCQKEAGIPSINFTSGENYISSDATVEALEPFMFGIQAKSNETTLEPLTKCTLQVFTGEDAKAVDTTIVIDNQTQFNFDAQIALPEGVYTFVATVYNDKDMTNECRMTITSVVIDTPLEVKDFTWNRHGGADATGLAEYGLQWTSNLKDVFAQIKPLEGYLLYEFESADWAETETITEKALLFAEVFETLPLAVFNKVSAFTPNSNMDYVIGTINYETGDAHILHITKSEISSFKGTDINIYGQAK